jgi:DNA-directed RNA polymerase specialized sigma24 family protein
MEYPGKRCWAKDHAAEVLRLKKEQGLSLRKLAEHFGKSIPTIRHALRLAREVPDPVDPS